jgi:hypothetical protein
MARRSPPGAARLFIFGSVSEAQGRRSEGSEREQVSEGVTKMPLKTLPAVFSLATALAFGSTLPAFALAASASTDVNVRECGSSRCDVVDVLHSGEAVDVQFCEGVWCAIRHPGADGYVHARYLVPDEDVSEEEFADLQRGDRRHRPDRLDRAERRERDIIIVEDDDDFFGDDDFFDDDDFFFDRRRFVRAFPFFGACIEGRNSRFCIWD